MLDIKEISSFADYFVIASGTSERMLNSLSNAVLREIKTNTYFNSHSEGSPHSGWLVLDYGDIVVHLMSPEKRSYYKLEELWRDGTVLLKLQ